MNIHTHTHTHTHTHIHTYIHTYSLTHVFLLFSFRNLLFEEDELRKMKDFGSGSDSGSGIQLLGFKPLSHLRRHHHIGPSSFLYPDEVYSR